jgi:hypothetical protein
MNPKLRFNFANKKFMIPKINSKTKKGGKELYFSLVSYNTHTDIMVILSKVKYKIYVQIHQINE